MINEKQLKGKKSRKAGTFICINFYPFCGVFSFAADGKQRLEKKKYFKVEKLYFRKSSGIKVLRRDLYRTLMEAFIMHRMLYIEGGALQKSQLGNILEYYRVAS